MTAMTDIVPLADAERIEAEAHRLRAEVLRVYAAAGAAWLRGVFRPAAARAA
jgi:hypothetical protein